MKFSRKLFWKGEAMKFAYWAFFAFTYAYTSYSLEGTKWAFCVGCWFGAFHMVLCFEIEKRVKAWRERREAAHRAESLASRVDPYRVAPLESRVYFRSLELDGVKPPVKTISVPE